MGRFGALCRVKSAGFSWPRPVQAGSLVLALSAAAHVVCRLRGVLQPPTPRSDPTASSPMSYGECRIFLLEVTGRREEQSARARCAVESAARAHPEWTVCLLVGQEGSASSQERLQQTREAFKDLGKVRVKNFHPGKIFTGTPIEKLWREHLRNRSSYDYVDSRMLSNMARAALLWRHGGIYLDLDVIVLRPFLDLSDNFVGMTFSSDSAGKRKFAVNNAVLGSKRPRSPFMSEHLARMPGVYSLKGDGTFSTKIGPVLLTTMLQKWCREFMTKAPDALAEMDCYLSHNSTVRLYRPEIFYPVHNVRYPKDEPFNRISNKRTREALNGILENSFALHLWNTKTRDWYSDNGSKIAPPGTLLWELARQRCPQTLRLTANGARE